MLGTVHSINVRRQTLDVSFGVELGELMVPVYVKLDWSARPGRQPFSIQIMRVRTASFGINRTGFW